MKDLLALIDGWEYALWAAGLGGAFFYVVAKGSAHLSDDNKSRLSLYLQGDTIGTWAENFCALFDTIFGDRHFSLKTFFRSAIASVLAVGALYILLGPILGHLGTRSGEAFPWLQVLAIGAAINIIPDYLSLWETRWMLQVFRRVRHPLLQLGVLALDFAISAAIIWGGVTVYRWWIGEAPIPLIEMAAIYSPYAIFFYSTFLTSLLAWIYWITSAFVKGFTGLGLNRFFNVSDARAGTTLGLTGGITVFLLSLATQPIAEMEDGRVDAMLCEWFPDVACVHGARLSADDQEKLDFLAKACEAGWEECEDEAFARFGVKDDEAFRLWSASCGGGSARSCTNLGILYRKARGVRQDTKKAIVYYEIGCKGGHGLGCTNLGVLYRDAQGVKRDYNKALSLFQRACFVGDSRGCTAEGFMHEQALGTSQSYSRAVSLFQKGCHRGDADGCTSWGALLVNGRGTAASPSKAVKLFDRGCKGGSANGCAWLGWAYENAQGVNKNLFLAETLYTRACDKGDMWACERLAVLSARSK